jgi:hypothetical protein
MKNGVFSVDTPCGSFKNRRFGGARFLRNVGSYKSHTALTTQKTPFFIVTAVKTSNLTLFNESLREWLILQLTQIYTSEVMQNYIK